MRVRAAENDNCRTCGGPITLGELVDLRFDNLHHLACVGTPAYNRAVMVDAEIALHLPHGEHDTN